MRSDEPIISNERHPSSFRRPDSEGYDSPIPILFLRGASPAFTRFRDSARTSHNSFVQCSLLRALKQCHDMRQRAGNVTITVISVLPSWNNLSVIESYSRRPVAALRQRVYGRDMKGE